MKLQNDNRKHFSFLLFTSDCNSKLKFGKVQLFTKTTYLKVQCSEISRVQLFFSTSLN